MRKGGKLVSVNSSDVEDEARVSTVSGVTSSDSWRSVTKRMECAFKWNSLSMKKRSVEKDGSSSRLIMVTDNGSPKAALSRLSVLAFLGRSIHEEEPERRILSVWNEVDSLVDSSFKAKG